MLITRQAAGGRPWEGGGTTRPLPPARPNGHLWAYPSAIQPSPTARKHSYPTSANATQSAVAGRGTCSRDSSLHLLSRGTRVSRTPVSTACHAQPGSYLLFPNDGGMGSCPDSGTRNLGSGDSSCDTDAQVKTQPRTHQRHTNWSPLPSMVACSTYGSVRTQSEIWRRTPPLVSFWSKLAPRGATI